VAPRLEPAYRSPGGPPTLLAASSHVFPISESPDKGLSPGSPFSSCAAGLARTAERTLVFADFTRARERPGPISEIPIPQDSPVQREWALLCGAPDLPA